MTTQARAPVVNIPGVQSAFRFTRLSATPSSSHRGLNFEEIPIYHSVSVSGGSSSSGATSGMTPEVLQAARAMADLRTASSGGAGPPPQRGFETPAHAPSPSFYIEPASTQPGALAARRKLNLDSALPTGAFDPAAAAAFDHAAAFHTPDSSGKKSRKRKNSFATPEQSPLTEGKSPLCGARYDSSLLLLTKRFLQLRLDCTSDVMNLNEAADRLGVQKRRLYDITNVLEGIDMIEKVGKNSIKWLSRGSICDRQAASQRALQEELRRETEIEAELDSVTQQMASALRLSMEDPTDCPYAYVRQSDLRRARGLIEQTLIAVRAPAGARLEVPNPRETGKLEMLVKSETGEQVEVFLCPHDENTATPQKPVTAPAWPSEITASSTSAEDSANNRPPPPASTKMECGSMSLLSELERPVAVLPRPSPLKASFLSDTTHYSPSRASSFMQLERPPDVDDYLYGLGPHEGIGDLFSDDSFALGTAAASARF